MPAIVLKFNGQELNLQIRDEADQSVMREIFKLREYKVAEEKIAEARVILDVGAHAGFFTLYCRILNPSADVYAMEPIPENIEALKEHLEKNNMEGVEIIEAALAKATEKRKIVITEDSHNNFLDEAGEKEVQAYSFKDFCDKNDLARVDVLKMDIEGSELNVLESCKDKLSNVKNLFVEYHSFTNQKQRLDKIIKILLNQNFRLYISAPGFASRQPFISRNIYKGMDMQLSIYAYRA